MMFPTAEKSVRTATPPDDDTAKAKVSKSAGDVPAANLDAQDFVVRDRPIDVVGNPASPIDDVERPSTAESPNGGDGGPRSAETGRPADERRRHEAGTETEQVEQDQQTDQLNDNERYGDGEQDNQIHQLRSAQVRQHNFDENKDGNENMNPTMNLFGIGRERGRATRQETAADGSATDSQSRPQHYSQDGAHDTKQQEALRGIYMMPQGVPYENMGTIPAGPPQNGFSQGAGRRQHDSSESARGRRRRTDPGNRR